MIGKVIGNYKITEFIEEGGMGTIYKGTHIKLERTVAVKKLHQNLTSNPQFKERFLNEAKILAKLSHPNIINIYDFLEDEEQFYIVAEFVEGKPLDYMISNNMLSSTEQKIQLFKQILKGIGYAHISGVVHRDIKPSNVMIQNDEAAKILDFGIAKLSDSSRSLTKTGTKMGSLYYMSPEQVLGKNLDERTDIYSLGVLFFEMLTNKLPYNTQTESDFELMNSIVSQEMPDINNLVSGLAPNLGNVIKKACAKDLSERFSTCEEFSAALDAMGFTFTETNTDFGKTQFITPDGGKNVSQKTVFVQPSQNTDDASMQTNQKSKKNGILIVSGFLIMVMIGFLIYVLTSNDIDSELNSRSEENSTEKSAGTNSKTSSNSSTNSSTDNTTTYSSEYSSSAALETARSFISDLGNRNFSSAYGKQRNKGWGSFDVFSSTKSFGGITSTNINEASLNYENSDGASVYVDYNSYDPYNKDGRYKQNFILKKYTDGWKIVKVENISIDQW
ncbi:MAG: serine/threonine-protein kinase [Ignavibacteria bacterium]